MAADEVIGALARAHNRQASALNRQSADAIGRLWDLTVSDPTDETLDLWVRRAGSTDRAYRLTAAQMAEAYVQVIEPAMLDGGRWSGQPIDSQAIADSVRNGVPAEDLWARPMIRLRSLLGESALRDALKKARAYAEDIQSTNTSLATRNGAAASMATSKRIVGYRRVTDGNACDFCLLASTQRYTLGALMPLHGGTCGCTVVPIVGARDPGQVIDSELLGRLREKAKDLKASGLRDEYAKRVEVKEHGELGPVLVPKGSDYTDIQAIQSRLSTNEQKRLRLVQAWNKSPAGKATGGFVVIDPDTALPLTTQEAMKLFAS